MNADKAEREHFDTLRPEEKVNAIYRMTDTGYTASTIATATKLSVEMVQQILAERE